VQGIAGICRLSRMCMEVERSREEQEYAGRSRMCNGAWMCREEQGYAGRSRMCMEV
jgi:hypothetical protein